jgi:hypothetical protein
MKNECKKHKNNSVILKGIKRWFSTENEIIRNRIIIQKMGGAIEKQANVMAVIINNLQSLSTMVSSYRPTLKVIIYPAEDRPAMINTTQIPRNGETVVYKDIRYTVSEVCWKVNCECVEIRLLKACS